jgi:hypothetical protein
MTMSTNTVDGHVMARAVSFGDQHSTEIIRANETQVWFLAEHLVETSLVSADP